MACIGMSYRRDDQEVVVEDDVDEDDVDEDDVEEGEVEDDNEDDDEDWVTRVRPAPGHL